MQLGGGKHKIDMGGRLLEGFQEGIKRLGCKHMNFIDDDDFIATFDREKTNIFFQFPYFLDTAVGCPVNLQDIHRVGPRDFDAIGANLTWIGRDPLLAIERLGKNARDRSLPYAAGSSKKVGVSDAPLYKGVAQCLGHVRLTYERVKILWPPSAG